MIVIPALSPLLHEAGKQVVSWTQTAGRVIVDVAGPATSAPCPSCGQRSSRVHAWIVRTLADCPSFGVAVLLRVHVWRFKCVNSACSRATFCESVEPLAARRYRRTWRLRQAHGLVGWALGGRAGGRLAAGLGMRVHGSTLLTQLRAEGPRASDPEQHAVIGLDDCALARARRYGTIVVDLQRRCPIELLPGRDGAAAADWLARHPEVEIIARDRHGPYALAAERARPQAQQVADRWHLLGNLADALERLLLRSSASMREAARQAGQAQQTPPVDADGDAIASPRLSAAQRRSLQRRQARLARYEDVTRRRRAGESIHAIARHTGLDRHTVRKFANADAFPERSPRAPTGSIVDEHRPYLRRRAAQGVRNATAVWRELRERGFTGGRSVVRDAFAPLRPATGGPGTASSAPPSALRACGWLLGWSRRPRSPETRSAQQWRLRFVAALCRLDDDIAQARRLAQQFFGVLVRQRTAEAFDRWMSKARTCTVVEIRRFARGLLADYDAVRAAVTLPWSSGQVEGQINRLKLIKRQMYGRAKLDLLRARVLHPN